MRHDPNTVIVQKIIHGFVSLRVAIKASNVVKIMAAHEVWIVLLEKAEEIRKIVDTGHKKIMAEIAAKFKP